MDQTLVILDHVSKFYSQSFNQLITLTVAILTFSGVVLPILIGIYQRRFFKIEHDSIEASLKVELDTHFNQKLNELELKYQQNEQYLKDEIELLEAKVQKHIDGVTGGIYHVQGMNQLDRDVIFPR